ncbi:MAG: 50S ribosomal protein L3 [Ignavibacteriae bacterium]|nr:MAG: 50S ribosomal protein L3 [Ignavibacteriota bacterium]
MPGLLGKKIGMTSIFTEDGNSQPTTVLEVGPCKVCSKRTIEKDGYKSVQLGYGKVKEKKLNKSQKGYFNSIKQEPSKILKEFQNFDNYDELKVGDELNVEMFNVGEKVVVTGVSKGKGFQGVMKRHGFGGVGGTTHGQGDRLRAPGSIGQSSYPSRVFKGTRMAGRTGNQKTSTKNLKIIKIVPEENLIFVKGAVPGAVNSLIEINK